MKENKASPLPLVHIKLVQVSSQAVLVGTEGLVASMDVDASGVGVKNAAVAIATLDQRPICGHHAPQVLAWRVTNTSFTEKHQVTLGIVPYVKSEQCL